MTKTKSIQLSQELMQAATSAAKDSDKTPTEQIEYGAVLGRKVDKAITLDDMLDVFCGTAQLKVEKITPPHH